MKKRILICLAAWLLLFSLAACKKDKTLPGGGNAGFPPIEEDSGNGNSTDEGNTNVFFDKHGYTEDFAIRFCKGDDVLDTAKGEIICAGVTYRVDFTDMLAACYNTILEHNFQNLPEDMTCAALTGTAAPEGTEKITLSVTELGKTHTVTTDAAAMTKPTGSHPSNLSALVSEFSGLLSRGAENAAGKTEK